MSQTIPISSTSKKRLDEKNGKSVKDLSLQLENRNCVECGMRGPTYVDVTTTSFCCASCAGVLRGINPPHRIKSISMATFTCEEVESLKSGGNDLNRRTWMGLHSGPQVTNFASKEDRTNFITDKYEKRKWYVSPEEVAKQKELLERAVEAKSEQLKMTSQRNDEMDLFSSVSLGGGTQLVHPPPSVSLDSVFAPPSMLSGIARTTGERGAVNEPHAFSPPAFMAPPPPQPGSHPSSLPINQQPTHMPINFAFGSPPSGMLPHQTQSTAAVAPSPVDPFSPLNAMPKTTFPKETKVERLSYDPFGGDLFGPPTTTAAAAGDPFAAPSFAGFAVKFDDDTPTTSVPVKEERRGVQMVDPFDVFSGNSANVTEMQTTVPPSAKPSIPPPSTSSSLGPFASLGSLPLPTCAASSANSPVPATTVSPHPSSSPSIPPVVANNDADKYSALAELDEMFHTTTVSDSSNGKPSWISTGFSAPPPTAGAPAFIPPTAMGRSNTMGAISSLSSLPSSTAPSLLPSSTAFGSGTWGIDAAPFSSPSLAQGFAQSTIPASVGLGGAPPPSNIYPQLNTANPQQYAQAAAMTGNPFAAFPSTQAPISHPSTSSAGAQHPNPHWNPFL